MYHGVAQVRVKKEGWLQQRHGRGSTGARSRRASKAMRWNHCTRVGLGTLLWTRIELVPKIKLTLDTAPCVTLGSILLVHWCATGSKLPVNILKVRCIKIEV